jgi:hypothetical protein
LVHFWQDRKHNLSTSGNTRTLDDGQILLFSPSLFLKEICSGSKTTWFPL